MANKKRLIDANALKWKLGMVTLYVSWLRCGKTVISKILESYRRAVLEEIDNAPTVDAVDRLQYDHIVNKLECLLCHATGGQYSKAGYALEDMERMVTDYIEECCEEAVAEEVVHGRWVLKDSCGPHTGGLHCSVCDKIPKSLCVEDFCPNCGAKMDGDSDES